MIKGEANQIYMSLDLGTSYTDISNYVKWDTVEITTRAFNDSYRLAQSQANFTLIYEPALYTAIRNCTNDLYIHIRHSQDDLKYDATLGFTTLGSSTLGSIQVQPGEYAMFTGHAPSTISRTYNGIMDNTMMQVDARDFSDLLQEPCGDVVYRWTPTTPYQLYNPANPGFSIMHQLVARANMGVVNVDNSVSLLYPPNNAPANTIFAVAPPNEDSTVLDVLDVLFHEYGYALSTNEFGRFTIIPWIRSQSEPIAHTFNDFDMMETQEDATPKEYNGVKLKYFPLAEGVMTNGSKAIQLFKDAELPYGNDSAFLGYTIYPGFTYPPLTNVNDPNNPGSKTVVYQEYTDSAIKYFTDKQRPADNMTVYRDNISSDFTAMVATWDHVVDFGASPDIAIEGVVEFYNKKARVVLKNNGATAQDLFYLVIKGNVLYKASEREAKSADIGKNPFEYTALYLSDEAKANTYVKAMASQLASNNYRYTFMCQDRKTVGSLVRVTFNDDPTVQGVECIIVERRYSQSETYKWEYVVRRCNRAETSLLSTPVKVPSVAYQPYTGRYRGTAVGAFPVMMEGDWALALSDFEAEELIKNGNLASGSSGWTLGSGARVRQQGWVAKFGTNAIQNGIQQSIVAIPGAGGRISGYFNNNGATSGGARFLRLSWRNSSNQPLNSTGGTTGTTFTDAQIPTTGSGWILVQNLTLWTAPAGTTSLSIQIIDGANNTTSGEWYCGFLYLPDGVFLPNGDFADGTSGWTSLGAPWLIVYDPSKAYMGNAMPGGGGNTLTISAQGSIHYPQQSIPVNGGDQYYCEVFARSILSGGGSGVDWGISWFDSANNFLSFGVFGNYSTEIDFTKKSAILTAPSNAARGAVNATVETTDGLWLIGSVSVKPQIKKGTVYLKAGGIPAFKAVTDQKYIAEAQTDILALNAVMVASGEPAIPEAENFINNLTTNRLSIYNQTQAVPSEGDQRQISTAGGIAFYKYISGAWTEVGGFSAENVLFDTEDYNVSIGYDCLPKESTGDYNFAIGSSALKNNTGGHRNLALGVNALHSNVDGTINVAIGLNTLYKNVGGDGNVAIGVDSLRENTQGNGNIAIGAGTLYDNTIGSDNVAVGRGALGNNVSGATNTGVGDYALTRTVAGIEQTTYDYTVGIGPDVRVSGSNQAQVGNSTAPYSQTLYGCSALTVRSDERDKTDIIPTVFGLSFINKIKPVQFRLDYRDDYMKEGETFETLVKDGSKKRSRFHQGFLAQQVKQVADDMGEDFAGYMDSSMNGGDDVKSLKYEYFIAPMVKAIQELSHQVKDLQAEVANLHSQNTDTDN